MSSLGRGVLSRGGIQSNFDLNKIPLAVLRIRGTKAEGRSLEVDVSHSGGLLKGRVGW